MRFLLTRTSPTRRSGSSCRRSPGTVPSCASASTTSTRSGAQVLTEAFAEPRKRYGIEMPLDALVSLVITFNEGIILERLSGVEEGHASSSTGSTAGWRRRRSNGTTEAISVAREQTRARYPDRDGLRRARRRPRLLRGLRLGASRRCCSCRRGRSSTLGTGRCRFRTSRATVAFVTFDRSRERALGPAARRPRRTTSASSRRTRSPCSMRRTPNALCSSASRSAPSAGSCWPPSIPSVSTRLVFIGPHFAGRRPAHLTGRAYPIRRAARHRRGLGEVQRSLLASRLPRLRRVLHVADVHRAALDEADRGRRRLGARDGRRDARRDSRRAGSDSRGGVARASAAAFGAPCS